MESNQSNAAFGGSVSNLGDLNNDGYDDVIVGAIFMNGDKVDQGWAFVYYGSSTGIITVNPYSFTGGMEESLFGGPVAGAGDLNNDGLPDFMVGSKWYSNPETYEGGVYIYLSCNGEFYPDSDLDGFGDDSGGVFTCSAPPGYVNNNSDCNDADNLIFPGATETCNTLDDDCDALVDEDIVESVTISAAGPTTFCQGNSVVLNATYTGAAIQWKKNGTNIPGATSSSLLVGSKGTYRAETSSACDSDLSTGIEVNVNKNPPASITAGGATTFCDGGSVVLTANAGAGLSYQWTNTGATIAGATLINYTATTAGNYKCRVTKTATGCNKLSNGISVSVPCRESEWSVVNGESGFTIYPNPANDKLNIQINSQLLSPLSFLLTITDLEGRIIYSSELNSPTTEINISDFASGMYFVKVYIDGKELTEKFIKE
jgi:hypothetical protein